MGSVPTVIVSHFTAATNDASVHLADDNNNVCYFYAVGPLVLFLLTMGPTIAEIWRFFDFSRWRPPPSWIF